MQELLQGKQAASVSMPAAKRKLPRASDGEVSPASRKSGIFSSQVVSKHRRAEEVRKEAAANIIFKKCIIRCNMKLFSRCEDQRRRLLSIAQISAGSGYSKHGALSKRRPRQMRPISTSQRRATATRNRGLSCISSPLEA